MSVDWKTFELPDQVDIAARDGLHAFLLAHQSEPVRLSAARLRRVDTLLVQYLLCVAQDWAVRGLGFALTDVAAVQADTLTLIGVTSNILPWEAAA